MVLPGDHVERPRYRVLDAPLASEKLSGALRREVGSRGEVALSPRFLATDNATAHVVRGTSLARRDDRIDDRRYLPVRSAILMADLDRSISSFHFMGLRDSF